ncbi:sulfotransferase family 2 domain-containing protein [Halomonas sabkhae]|uniref:sulfotransferase family 2 domain-containing protein n=1 Tax=Halomonas sabkhae TaxID=626223 RepID=UPI0025B53203|nr:sulfotransferase family 2 domain-containing protein [Halomonas sabkhae]MDN3526633.1 sulfotransferase family 2 domain-containing protein [Halomonas sabkhae]
MISHHHECLFVHIPKCGGQSVEMAFLKDLGLGWKNRAPLLLRQSIEKEKAPPRLAHLSVTEYLKNCYISNNLYDAYYKFSVTRDPYSRAVSLFNYLNIADTVDDFCERLERQVKKGGPRYWFMKPQVDYLKDDNGHIAVDDLFDLQELTEKWQVIRAKAGVSIEKLPHVNSSSDKRITVNDLTGEHLDFLTGLYAEDFERLGYSIKKA